MPFKTKDITSDAGSIKGRPPSMDPFDFMLLPFEIREQVIHYYLRNDRPRKIVKSMHWNGIHGYCCIWEWPKELMICEPGSKADLPDLIRPKWLPNIALLNRELRHDVTNLMLRSTKTITLKYKKNLYPTLIPWFGRFLGSLSGDDKEGFNAVHSLNFPTIQFEGVGRIPATASLETSLMKRCPKLRHVNMTFHNIGLIHHQYMSKRRGPYPLDYFLDKYNLRGMLDCTALNRVDIDGCIEEDGLDYDFDPLQTLRDFGKWLREGCKERGRVVDVRLHVRHTFSMPRGEGENL